MTSVNYRQMVVDLLRELSGQENIIAIPRAFITLTDGDYAAAAMLNQILYWQSRTKDPGGWFYKTALDWKNELALSEYQITRIMCGDRRNKKSGVALKSLGIETRVCVVKGTMTRATFYRVNWEVFLASLAQHMQRKANPTMSGLHAEANPTMSGLHAEANPTMSGLRTQQCRVHTETITETTVTETTSPASNDADAHAPSVPSKTLPASWGDLIDTTVRAAKGITGRARALLADAGGDWEAALAAQAQKLDTAASALPPASWKTALADDLSVYAALLKLRPRTPAPKLDPAVRDAIGEFVMEWGPRTEWSAYHWRTINARALVRDLAGFNLTVAEMRDFKRWYYTRFSQDARYSHPQIIASKIDLMRADVRGGSWTLSAGTGAPAAPRGGYAQLQAPPPGYEIPDDPELDALFEETVRCLGTPRVSASV